MMLNNQISPMRQHEISMLLSRQKAEFGINMYEAMTAADDIMIENLVRQGMDVDSAILSIFEQKYARLGGGRSKYVPEPAPMLPTDSGYIQPMFGGIGATLSQDEAEIELLISRGYTRIQAVQIYEQKKRRDYEVSYGNGMSGSSYGRAPHMRSSIQPRVSHLRMASDSSSYKAPANRYSPATSFYNNSGFGVGSASSRSGVYNGFADPNGNLSESFYGSGGRIPSGTLGSSFYGSTGAPSASYGSYSQRGGSFYPSVMPDQLHSVASRSPTNRSSVIRSSTLMRQQSALESLPPPPVHHNRTPVRQRTQSVISQTTKPPGKPSPDEVALEMGIMLSQQEAEVGINMYDSLTPDDEPEVNRLMNENGYTEREAILVIFNKKFKSENALRPGAVVVPGINSSSNQASRSTLTQSNTGSSGTTNVEAVSIAEGEDDDDHSHFMSVGSRSLADDSILADRMVTSATPADQRYPNGNSSVVSSSAREHKTQKQHHRRNSSMEGSSPLKKKFSLMKTVSKVFRPSNKEKGASEEKSKEKVRYKEHDAKVLMSMGFSRDQAVQALIECNHDANAAADRLLVNGL